MVRAELIPISINESVIFLLLKLALLKMGISLSKEKYRVKNMLVVATPEIKQNALSPKKRDKGILHKPNKVIFFKYFMIIFTKKFI
jgi:hypothetical protein